MNGKTDGAATRELALSEVEELKLEIEDLRFERDRYRASAARYQEKLIAVLDELELTRVDRLESAELRREIFGLSREFEKSLDSQRRQAEDSQRRQAESDRAAFVMVCAEFKRLLDAQAQD